MKPTYLLLYSGGLACTVTMLKSIQENLTPLLLFYKNYGDEFGPGGEGETQAVQKFSSRYGLQTRIVPYVARAREHITEHDARMMLEFACDVGAEVNLSTVVVGRRTFMDADLPEKRAVQFSRLFIPKVDHSDEDYRAALRYEPALFRDSFSCTKTYNLTPCGKCAHCRDRRALHARLR